MDAGRRYRLRHDGKEVDVVAPACVVGREADCELVVDDALVSRHHARLVLTDEGLVVEDLGSRNGVYVNQARIKAPTLLAHGDVVGFGLKSFELVDLELAQRKRGPTLPMPFHESDVDGPPPVTVTPMLGVLTEREREVFELIVLGYTQREIAEQLHLSVKTVETHRAHVADKLRCRTRAELVAYAITAGLLAKPGR
jgi:pSer/pThr/pTyr-binding forkhead associated (FHA) protein